MMSYVIYAKHRTQRQFRPIDNKAQRVVNLIFAARFDDAGKNAALDELRRCNPSNEWTFKARKVRGE